MKNKLSQVGTKWCVDTTVQLNGRKHRLHSRLYDTKKEAQAAYPVLLKEAMENDNVDGESMLFKDFLDEYRNYRSHKISASTVRMSDEPIIKCYLSKYEGMTLNEVFATSNVVSWYNELSKNTKVCSARKNKVLSLFKDMLKYAYNSLYINPKLYQLADVKCLSFKADNKHTERIAWTKEEKQRFLDAIPNGSIDKLMFELFLSTAPRIGEFLALMPKCFKQDRNMISIFQQVDYEGLSNNWTLTDRLKTHSSYRDIYITEALAQKLSDYIKDFNIKDDCFLWSAKEDHSQPLSRNAFRIKLANYIKTAGVRYCPPHAIRHMRATEMSEMCENMADIEAASGMLGHSVEIDLKVYASHNNEERAKKLVEKINKA